MNTPPAETEGRPYGKYRLFEPLGIGSRGTVYRAYELAIDRLVAVRIVPKPTFDDAAAASAFADRARADAQAAARLNHTAIAALIEYDDQGSEVVIASEYVQGWPMADVLVGRVTLGPVDVLCIARQMLEALAYAHAAGVPHGHLGPGGVLLGRSGHVKITGFGSPRLDAGHRTTHPESAGTLARRPYTAPECLAGEVASEAADLYACGALLRDLMTRALPLASAETDPLRASLPQRLAPLLQQACAVLPQDRPPSARALLDALFISAQVPFPGAVRVASMPPLAHSGRPVSGPAPEAAGPRVTAPPPDIADDGPTVSGPWAPVPPTWPVSGHGPDESTGPQAVGGHEPAALKALQDLMTRHIGPVAGVLIRRHAASAPSLRDLAARLAQEALPPEDHDAFFAQVARLPLAGGARPVAGPQSSASTGTGGASRPREPIPAEWLAQVQQALVAHMGPVGGVLLRQAQGRAIDRDDLLQRVLAQIDDDPEREALARVLQRLG
jgi:serine/threonine-protein kinase